MENIPTIIYLPGENIIREGDKTNDIFLIISGKVKVTKNTYQIPITLATQGKDTIFGEMTLIDGKRRSASVTAIEETKCYQCNGMALLKEIEKLPPDLRNALQSMATIIRERNAERAGIPKLPPENTIPPEDKPMPEERIKSDAIQNEINNITNPFLRSLFRVMMATAFKN